MNTTRRTLLSTAALLPLAACAGQTAAQVSAVIVTDLGNALKAIGNAVPAIAKADPALIPAAVQAQVVALAAQGAGVVSAVSASMTATAAAPALAKAEADLNAVLSALAAVPMIPPPYSLIIAAAAVVAPMIEGYISGITGAAAAPASTSVRAMVARVAPAMTVAQAEAVLAGAAK